MANQINNVEYGETYLAIHSHIDQTLFQNINSETLRMIYFAYEYDEWANGKIYPDKNDIRILNEFFSTHKQVTLDIGENSWIPLLPEVERFRFDKYDDEAIELLKNNTVKKLWFNYGPDKKADLTKLLMFRDTLEELSLDGNFKNLEVMLNEMKRLKRLELTSINIDFSLINELSVEDLYYHGSKTKEWDGIVKFPMLKKLCIKTNTIMENLDFLRELRELETVEILYCSKITCFPDLSHLKKLKRVYITECNRLENIEYLKKLVKVKIHADGKMIHGRFYDNDV